MNGISEIKKRCRSAKENIHYLVKYREITTKAKIIDECKLSRSTLVNLHNGKVIRDTTLDKIEPYVEYLAVKEGKTQFWECNGQIMPNGNMRYSEPDAFYECLRKWGDK